MKKILLLGTGGTIASVRGENGLAPGISAEELLAHVPQARELCELDSLQLLNLDSTNMEPRHWLQIASCIREHYDAYDGFVITHGTDTMAYTAAALSYQIQNSPKPIVLTGGQKSISMQDTDARRNLYDSLVYAADDGSRGVRVVFNGEVILGTRARKERTKSYNAFSSVDFPDVGIVREHRLIRYLPEDAGGEGGPVFYDTLNEHVLLLPLVPHGHRPEEPLRMLREQKENGRDLFDGLILQTFGVGGLPGGPDGELAREVRRWREAGKAVVLMTQVPYEGSDLSVYEVGRGLKESDDVIEAYSMTTEAVVTKLMWALGQSRDAGTVRRLFETPVQHDVIRA